MARYENQTFTDRTVLIDGHQFVGCRFERCTIEFRATALPQLINCHFENCRWAFMGHAADTVRFMMALYNNGDPVLQNVVEQSLNNIRKNYDAPLREEEVRPMALNPRE